MGDSIENRNRFRWSCIYYCQRWLCKGNVDIMIDDDWKIEKKLADNQVKTLYFKDTNLIKLEESEYIKEVNNWGEIYRYIKEK